MYCCGIDAHLNYLQVAVVDRGGKLILNSRVSTREPEGLVRTLAPFRPLEVVVETCPFWPCIYDALVAEGITFSSGSCQGAALHRQHAAEEG